MNGHDSPSADERHSYIADDARSDSDLSESHPAPLDAATPESDDAAGSPDDDGPEFTLNEQEELSESSEHEGVDDGDFDEAGSPVSAQSSGAADRVHSTSSRVIIKRKTAPTTEDDYMRENPELYGLRRSVWRPLSPPL